MMMVLLQPAFCIDAHEQLADPLLEGRARALSQKILCPTCQGQILDESPVESAVQLRHEIRILLSQGDTDEQIIESLEAHYGKQVIITPRMNISTYVLWFGPWVIFMLIVGAFLYKNRHMILGKE